MEKHKCKLCFKSYANGSALGGHMRSHMMNLPIQSKSQYQSIHEITPSSSSSASEADDDDDDKKHEHEDEHEQEKGSLNYGLRENPKKSFRLSDPGFAFVRTSSVPLQDKESETESQKNSTRRRSKRIRRSNITVYNYHHHNHFQEDDEEIKKTKCTKLCHEQDQEPVSSLSDATTEEDLAFCLMMLSRDEWENTEIQDDQEDEIDEYSDDSDDIKLCKTVRNRVGKYRCETCNKVFKSYQALGGHRASHKKNRLTTANNISGPKMEIGNVKIHECPYCYRVFSSGQALGGHKRSHLLGSSSSSIVKNVSKFGDHVLIDLNLPAQVEDDADEYFEVSAVSD